MQGVQEEQEEQGAQGAQGAQAQGVQGVQEEQGAQVQGAPQGQIRRGQGMRRRHGCTQKRQDGRGRSSRGMARTQPTGTADGDPRRLRARGADGPGRRAVKTRPNARQICCARAGLRARRGRDTARVRMERGAGPAR